jgi:hypothetical protein
MPQLDVPLSRLRFGQTSRKDAWWVPTLVWAIAFVVGFGYLTWGIIQPHNYWSAPYLTPLASPLLYGEGPHAWFGHTAWICPLSSCTSAENKRKPGRRVCARPAFSTVPEIAAVMPGRSEMIRCMRLRSS